MAVSILGKYPCICGAKNEIFCDTEKFNSRGPYSSLQDRISHLNKTDTWKRGAQGGKVAVFETMNVRGISDVSLCDSMHLF